MELRSMHRFLWGRRRARGDFRRCAHSGGSRSRLNVVASRPRSAAPAKITPTPPPPDLLVSARIAIPQGAGPVKKRRRLAAAGALRMVAVRTYASDDLRTRGARAYAGHPPVPSAALFSGDEYLEETEGSFQAQQICTPGRRARGAFRRCRGARAAGSLMILSSANRPSEHSGEKVSEPDDPGRSPGSKLPTKNVRNNWPDVTARDKSRNSQTEALPGGDSAVLPSRNAYLGHLPEVEHFIDLRIRQHMLALD